MRFRWNIKTSPVLQQSPFQLSNTLADAVIAQASTVAVCRCCGSRRTRSLGKLPVARIFAGSQLDRALPGGVLYRCLDCLLVFRDPIFSKSEYDALYRAGNATTWEEEDRLDQSLVRETLSAFLKQGSVLDIGCGAGNLLMPLVDRYRTHGAEINVQAAAIAETRGIRIIANDLDDMPSAQTFDAVIACDVIEHMTDPLEFLRRMLAMTASKGYVIITTGNAEAWSWRMAGSRFWYCFLPEHISFVSPRWFSRHAPGLGARVMQSVPFTYSPQFTTPGRELRLALMALFRISPTLYYRLLPRIKRNNIPVGRGITRDHFLVTLQKN